MGMIGSRTTEISPLAAHESLRWEIGEIPIHSMFVSIFDLGTQEVVHGKK